jgi:menaquinol-cytochrome c reductase cytochrome b/c subunit
MIRHKEVGVNEEQKQKYHDKYVLAKQKGEKFWPDIIYKDLLVSFAIFLLLVGLATFLGVANEPKADPNDSAYIPRPEWYFLFLFQLLKYFPGKIEWVGTVIVPMVAVLALFLLPFYDHNPARHWSKRKLGIGIMTLIVIGMAALTVIAMITTPKQTETAVVATTLEEKISAGQDLYSLQCTQCHGPDGEGGIIQGVTGLDGFKMKAIHSQDEMYTRSDDTINTIISSGQPSLGMPPFGRAAGGELGPGDIEAIVTFMRYTWDDRVEKPKQVVQAGAIPPLAPNAIPSYDNVAPIIKRYCLSCHHTGSAKNNYDMSSYQSLMTSGDHKPNVRPGDANSNLVLMINRQKITAGEPMPPTKALPPDLLDIIQRWVLAGAPEKAVPAGSAQPAATPTPAKK